MQKDKQKKEKIFEEIRELVVARLEVLPKDKKISIGSFGEFTKSELIEHVKKDDELGKKIINIELKFLRALAQGKLLDEILAFSKPQDE